MKSDKIHSTVCRTGKPRSNARRWWAAPLTFVTTLLAFPGAAAIVIPDAPLTTGSRVPPNIMFILDNSGSMAMVSMPTLPQNTNNDVQPSGYNGTPTGADRTGLRDDPMDRSYLNNGIYYNPWVTYQPWMRADGERMTGGTSVDAVYSSWNLASGSTRDLRANTESIFYVPHDGVVPSMNPDPADYDKYSISAAGQVVRHEYNRPAANLALPAGPYSSTNNNEVASVNITVPAGAANLRVFTTGGNSRVRLDVYRANDSRPTCTSQDGNGGETCSIPNPQTGIWRATLRRDGSGSGNSANFSGVWIDALVETQAAAVPNPARTQAQELENFATWYSYYRTRLKTAKAGASEAFAGLSREMRVGYTPINDRPTGLRADSTQVVIPVNNNNGLFEGANKTNWFSSVQSEVVKDGSTPLRTTLKAVGDYFTRSDSNGPWGPGQPADQLACRQSFAILTTDGYWNDSGAFSGIGDADGDGNHTTLADIARHYYITDLRDGGNGLPNKVPTTASNPANWQHMVTFGISIGLRGNMEVTNPPPAPDSPLWTNPMDREDADRIDDLWHATVNSRGRFVAASDPDTFRQALQAALNEIVERVGSFSNVAANSTSLDAGTRVFQANYVSNVWTGELRSQSVSIADGVDAVDCSGPSQPGNGWCASKGIPTTGRKVFTSNGHFDGANHSVTTPNQAPRSFPSEATEAQLESLARPGPVLEAPVSGEQNAAYIAGDRSLEMSEGGSLRNRNHLLGDIVGSSPAYVEDTGTVYIGANDGMLHAFDAASGDELFAYIPGIINWRNLSDLSRPDYGHRYFVDGPIVVTSRQQTPGKNLLVGTLGKGGKGLFALDVTVPTSFGEGNNVLWEVRDTPNENMGLVQGRPILTKLNVGGTSKDVVVLGNGVNSASGRAALIILDLADGSVVGEIPVGPTGVDNGLSAPAGVLGSDGRTLAYVYAGDMQGNVWKFDLTGDSAASWTAKQLFAAVDEDGLAQPISGGLTVAVHPLTNKRWVFFGTGRFMTQGDVASVAVQSLYGFVDEDEEVAREDLTRRTVQVTGTVEGFPVRGFESRAPLPADSKGWYIDLPGRGERIIQDAQIVSTFLITASIIPSGDACESGGSGFVNALDAFTGTSAGGSYFDLDGDGSTADELVGDPAVPVGSINLGAGMPTLPNLLRGRLVVGGSAGVVGGPSRNDGTRTLAPRWDRASWREIRGD
ncbi:type IV pilus assembly protein PilY1 [Luteimonas sp. J16]|uniref:pilus assembly protein n=1 Tax=unclassified Luteimonas TaxID=2629088 RepID=UPI0004B23C81|nr:MULTISPECIES: PilC/PilY family type IV pilus protein [unclassified Luteimonas]TWG90751.1 type IV pilus assembly protein PilY1 [Luteimonas sp. J16]